MKTQHESEGRIVLEALTHVSFDGVVVRVYQEEPLIVHYAKRATSQSRIDTITHEAVAVFESLPGHLEDAVEQEMHDFGIDLAELLNPIPPPFKIEEIVDAEQVGAGDAEEDV